MCNPACIEFARTHLDPGQVRGREVLEVGALDVNGSLRPWVESMAPARYLGVDIALGPGVDDICDACGILQRYGPNSFDVLLSTELLEHVRDWRAAIRGFKHVLRPGGIMLLTTRSHGHPFHGYPFDFWRFELDDMRAIFADLEIEALERDPAEPGVFVKARKPVKFAERPLDDIALYSMVAGRRLRALSTWREFAFRAKTGGRRRFARARYAIVDTVLRLTPRPLKNAVKRALPMQRARRDTPPRED